MAGVIGRADEFYRLRVIRVDESDVPDLDWRDDVLYRRTTATEPTEADCWRVEAVDLDDDENVTVLATFAEADEAYARLGELEAELAGMTRSQFEKAYFPEGESGPEDAPDPS